MRWFILASLLLLAVVLSQAKADLDGDGDVDFNDLIATLNIILSSGYNSAADIDNDGDVDFNDLIGVLNAILMGGSPINPVFEPQFGVNYSVKVVDVIDGDTIDVILPNGTEDRVRLLGVDTPETTASANQPNEYDGITDLDCLASWGLEAKRFTSQLEGKYVKIEFDSLAGFRGYYGRLLAYVYYNDMDFNAELVKRGYARVYTEGDFTKESKYLAYQNRAMENNTGLWICRNESPVDVRIYYVHYDAYGNDNYNLNDEYVVLINDGDVAVNLAGWMLMDEANHVYVFPEYILNPGETVTIHSGSGVDSEGHLYWGSSWAIWNNDGDTAYLFNSQGELVDSYSW